MKYAVYVDGKRVKTYKNPRPAGEHVRRLRLEGQKAEVWFVYLDGSTVRWF